MPTLSIPLGPTLTAEQAERIYKQGQEAVVFALLELAKMLAEKSATVSANASPTTPSGMKPPYEKPTVKSRRKRPGCKEGHPGSRRPPPERIDQREEHRLKSLSRVRRSAETLSSHPHPLHRRHSRRHPAGGHGAYHPPRLVPTMQEKRRTGGGRRLAGLHAGQPRAGFGGLVALRPGQHALANRRSLQLPPANEVDAGGFDPTVATVAGDSRTVVRRDSRPRLALGGVARRRDQLAGQRENALAVVFCDRRAYLFYDRPLSGQSGAVEVLHRGISRDVGDRLLGAYNKVVCSRRQMCLVHLLRDFLTVEKYKSPGPHWPAFAKPMRRLIHDAMRLSKRDDLSADEYASRRSRLDERLQTMIDTPWDDSQAKRLIKRLRRHQRHLFTFLDQPDVPFDNNHGERSIRPAVIIRKNSYCNRSPNGARAQAVLMSIYRTLKQRGHDPITTVTNALTTVLDNRKITSVTVQNHCKRLKCYKY